MLVGLLGLFLAVKFLIPVLILALIFIFVFIGHCKRAWKQLKQEQQQEIK
jgi:uncharacterized membrane protein